MINDQILTIADATDIGRLLSMCQRNARVTFAVDGDLDRLITGTMRRVGVEGGGRLGDDDDVRDGFIHISATFEHFIPVRECLSMLSGGLLAEGDFT